MTSDLAGKTAVVTGGTRGIGLAVARAFLAEGAGVFICGRTSSSLQAALEELGRAGGSRAAGIAADVRRHGDCRKLMEAAAERFGGIDVLVNNAGVGLFKPVDEIAPEEWDSLIATNLSGVFYCTREAVPHLRRRGGGYIFNISSLLYWS